MNVELLKLEKMLTIIIVLVVVLLIYISTRVRMNQDKKPTIPTGLSYDLRVARQQIESAYSRPGIIVCIARGSICQEGTSKVVRMYFADGCKYVRLIPGEVVYCVEREYEDADGNSNDVIEFYSKWGNLFGDFSSPSSLPSGYSFESKKGPNAHMFSYKWNKKLGTWMSIL